MHEIVWTRRAQSHMKAAFDYISLDSPTNAKKVIHEIIAAVEKSLINPEIHPPDKL